MIILILLFDRWKVNEKIVVTDVTINELRKMKEAQNKAMLAKIPPAPLPDAKPQKSILKNTSSYTPPIVIPSNISLRY